MDGGGACARASGAGGRAGPGGCWAGRYAFLQGLWHGGCAEISTGIFLNVRWVSLGLLTGTYNVSSHVAATGVQKKVDGGWDAGTWVSWYAHKVFNMNVSQCAWCPLAGGAVASRAERVGRPPAHQSTRHRNLRSEPSARSRRKGTFIVFC
eukprot:COSAG02_NODE_11128_length_1787_cov_0.663507_2_plen_151_part_00